MTKPVLSWRSGTTTAEAGSNWLRLSDDDTCHFRLRNRTDLTAMAGLLFDCLSRTEGYSGEARLTPGQVGLFMANGAGHAELTVIAGCIGYRLDRAVLVALQGWLAFVTGVPSLDIHELDDNTVAVQADGSVRCRIDGQELTMTAADAADLGSNLLYAAADARPGELALVYDCGRFTLCQHGIDDFSLDFDDGDDDSPFIRQELSRTTLVQLAGRLLHDRGAP